MPGINPLLVVVAVMSGLLSFGFLLGVIIPLLGWGAYDPEKAEDAPWYTHLADLILMLYDTLPVFAIFRAILGVRELPAVARAMKARWQDDNRIRRCFRSGMVCLVVFGVSLAVIFRSI